MSSTFELYLIIFTEWELRKLLEQSHKQGFLDGLENRGYVNQDSIGYEDMAEQYADGEIERIRQERQEYNEEEDDDESYIGHI